MACGPEETTGQREATHSRGRRNRCRAPPASMGETRKELYLRFTHGKKTLADLFDGRSQLIIYHFMFGPDWKEGCPSCSFNMDHTDAALVHLAQRDVSFVAISRAPYPKIAG